MRTLLHDLRYGFRMLRKSPGFTAAALGTLTLGIGATTAIFSVADATMFEPLPYPDPERLVHVWETTPEGADFSISESTYLDFSTLNQSFTAMAAYRSAALNMTGAGEPVRLQALAATHTFFPLLGADAVLGRTFSEAEDRPGAERVVVLSHELWQQRFAGDRSVLGRSITLDGSSHTVIGVIEPDFDLTGAELWVALRPDPHHDRGDHWLDGIGRLRPDVGIERATADLAGISRRIAERHPKMRGWGVRLASFSQWIVGADFRRTMYVLLAAVGFLLLLACANLANLLFVRATTRRKEIGIRAALGAARTRLVRQLLTESVLLALLGSVAGLLTAVWAIDALQALEPGGVPRLDEVAIDGRVMAFALGMGLLTSLIFGVAPAVRASRADVGEALRAGGGGTRGGSERNRGVRDVLVVAQVALAIVLLVGAGLLMRSFTELQRVDPGFRAENAISLRLQLSSDEYSEPWQKVVFLDEVARQIRGLPGVVEVGATAIEPFSDFNLVNDVTPSEKAAEVGPAGYLQAGWRVVTPGFFQAMGIPVVRGRVFGSGDRWDGPRLTVISRTLAERLWPDDDPVGKRLFWGGTDGTPLTVVGVVGDYRDFDLAQSPPPLMFLPYNQLPWPEMTLIVRGSSATDALTAAVRQQIRALDPQLPVQDIRPLSEPLSDAMAAPRFRTVLLGFFSVVALLLAAVGIYGVMAFTVAQRTREIGIRLALGARSVRVSGMVLKRAGALVVLGAGLGLAGALGLTRFLESLLYGTTPTDAVTFLAVPVVLALVGLLAGYVPARRATRVDPMIALRNE